MSHQLNITDIDPEKEHVKELAGAYGRGERKNLSIVSTVSPLTSYFVVKNHDKVVYKGRSIRLAIQAYNEAKPKRE